MQLDQALPGFDVEVGLDFLAAEDCVSGGRQDFFLGDFSGQYELFGSCGGTATVISNVVLVNSDNSVVMFIVSQAVVPEDIGAIGVALETLEVNPLLVP